MSTVTMSFREPTLWCSRVRHYKRDADRDALWMSNHGGKYVKVTGKRGFWRVRAKMPVCDFAQFCSIEAAREGRKLRDELRVT